MIIDQTDYIICGMPSEAAILTAAFPHSAIGCGQAKNNLATLVPSTCKRIISMGLCGGLAPPVKVPDVIIASTLANYDGFCIECDQALNACVVEAGSNPLNPPWSRNLNSVPWFSSGVLNLADTVQQRADLFKKTGAVAIDDESYAAAVFCASHSLKFNIVRAVSDDYRDTIPPAARGAIMNADGSPDIAYLLGSLETETLGEDFDLFAVAAAFNSSLANLQGVAQALAIGS